MDTLNCPIGNVGYVIIANMVYAYSIACKNIKHFVSVKQKFEKNEILVSITIIYVTM